MIGPEISCPCPLLRLLFSYGYTFASNCSFLMFCPFYNSKILVPPFSGGPTSPAKNLVFFLFFPAKEQGGKFFAYPFLEVVLYPAKSL